MTKKSHPDFKFLRLIGEGSFSTVYLAVDASAVGTPTPANQKQNGNKSTSTTDTNISITNTIATACNNHKIIANEQDSNQAAQKIEDQDLVRKTTPQVHQDNHRQTTNRVRKYAIKVCQKSHIKREGKHKAIMREKEIMNVLNINPHRHFIRLYCTFQDYDRLFFVMSYAEKGDLTAYIKAFSNTGLPKTTTQFYALQILSGLEHLHNLGIVHRDLKPDNLLLDANMNILVTDFGSAKFNKPPPVAEPVALTGHTPDTLSAPLINIERRNSFVGSAEYVSPEVLQSRPATHMSDLWALGVTVYQMLSARLPFNARNEYLVFKRILNLDYDTIDFGTADARDFIDNLLRLVPNERMGAVDRPDSGHHEYKSLRQHEFLTPAPGQDAAISIGREHLIDKLNESKSMEPAEWLQNDADLMEGLDKIEPGLGGSQVLRLMRL